MSNETFMERMLREDIDRLTAELKTANNLADQMCDRADRMEAELAHKQEQLDSTAHEVLRLEQELAEEREDLERLQQLYDEDTEFQYNEIGHLGGKLEEVEQRAKQAEASLRLAEKERDVLLAAVEASENEKKQYRRESDRYREALDRIRDKRQNYDDSFEDCFCNMIHIARKALEEK